MSHDSAKRKCVCVCEREVSADGKNSDCQPEGSGFNPRPDHEV